MGTVSFKTIDGENVTLPAKDYLYKTDTSGDPAACTVVFYIGDAPDGGFRNAPYRVSAQEAKAIERIVAKVIFGL